MKKLALALVAYAALGTPSAFAQAAAAPAATPDWTFSANLGLFSDYRFRGISQTNEKAAFQGGFDLAHSSGFYVGNWNSNVDSAFYNGANLEMDFYGGFKKTFDAFGLDVGTIYYYYPGSGSNPAGSIKIKNAEVYIGGSFGPLSAKYSYAVTDFFGALSSKGSSYLDLGFSSDVGSGFGLNAHYGYQYLKGDARAAEIGGTFPGADNTSDWKIGGTYTVDGWVLGLAYVATNRDYTAGSAAVSNKSISSGTAVASVSKSF
jgi:uncharacterized protein (TIGR02001 family)